MARQEKSVPVGTISLQAEMAPKSRRDLKREAILAVAKEMFFAQGYSRVSMDDIVARVSGSKATLYSHFPSKDQLLLALVQEATVGAISEAVHPDPGQDFPAFLRTYGRIGLRWRTSADVVGLERLAASEACGFQNSAAPVTNKACSRTGGWRQTNSQTRWTVACCAELIRCSQQISSWACAPAGCGGGKSGRHTCAEHGTNQRQRRRSGRDLRTRLRQQGSAREEKSHQACPGARELPAPIPAQQPAKLRRDLKREAIIAAAKQLFFAEGYAGVSINRVVERVGGSKATLYSHFPSKQALLLAVVQDVEAGQSLDAPPGVCGLPTDFRVWLSGFGRVATSRLMSDEFISLQRLAAGEAVQLPEVGKAFYEASIVPAFTQFAACLSDAMDRGELRRAPAELAAEQFVRCAPATECDRSFGAYLRRRLKAKSPSKWMQRSQHSWMVTRRASRSISRADAMPRSFPHPAAARPFPGQ